MYKDNKKVMRRLNAGVFCAMTFASLQAAAIPIADSPLFVTQSVPPLTMLVMGRDHKLYYEAYNDASDLNGDGNIDVGYKPLTITYFGYFDSEKCYVYDSTDARFEPSSTAGANKTCSDASEWSGDFLNYVTTTRLDAMRKVLYGGDRVVDETDTTVLRRTHIPQDAHSWAKEYNGSTLSGYSIADYTPLSEPPDGYRHIFANVSLSDAGQPLMRVLTNTSYRAWEWVSIERPVAGSQCNSGSGRQDCTTASGSSGTDNWEVVPSSALSSLDRRAWRTAGYHDSPENRSEMDSLFSTYRTGANRFVRDNPTTLEADPWQAGQDDFITRITGTIRVPVSGTWEFAIDGDDAVDLFIDGTLVASYYGAHSDCECQNQGNTGTISLNAGEDYNIELRHQEQGGDAAYRLYWNNNLTSGGSASTMTDYDVKVQVCVAGMLEDNCTRYPNGNYKPTGLLQDYGESEEMEFGLITGSYAKNTSGGVLRKKMGALTDEIIANTGQFSATVGIIKSINQLKIMGFDWGSHAYSCGWIVDRAINEGECAMWGNPIAEMMYEGLRYFAGEGEALSAYSIAATGNNDATLGLPLATWDDPYENRDYCAKPFQLVISDINPSYDSDQLPGSAFASGVSAPADGPLSELDVEDVADAISSGESDISGNRYIGQVGDDYDGSPAPKAVTSLGNVRGLSPEEPTKQGSYYSASIAHFGRTTDINEKAGTQNMQTFVVALASPLPRIEFDVNGQTITLVPFAKSVGRNGGGISADEGDFQPTNQIVDFYVEALFNLDASDVDPDINGGRPYGKFRINYEDVEQGADHDMDAIAVYHFYVDESDNVIVNVESAYAAGGIKQHMGYVISGTTADGTYLVVRDVDTGAGDDPDYFLDTPPGQGPGGTWDDDTALPLVSSRTFTPGTTTAATLMKGPLWYAAKWGGFEEDDNIANNLPDREEEWDADADGTPDNYFLVTNALGLKAQLSEAFEQILGKATSASAVATNSTRLDSDTVVYQARFVPGNWSGDLLAYALTPQGDVGDLLWEAADLIPAPAARNIVTWDPEQNPSGRGVNFTWAGLNNTQQGWLDLDASGTDDDAGEDRLDYLRGDTSMEQRFTGGIFRNRLNQLDQSNILGDIVNSDPVFVGHGNYGYSTLDGDEGTSYTTFRQSTAYTNRPPMIYVGANDGMLHGFDGATGVERFAYVPNNVIPNLSKLTDPDYQHRYFVDAPAWAGDAYIGGDWKTLLVGATGAGGRAVFALDVTDPANFDANDVMWEFTDAELGTAMGQPRLARLEGGQWVVVFGNGYNSDSGQAALFILDAADGSLLKRIDFPASDIDGDSVNDPNGLATPVLVDTDGDKSANLIYAGDLHGRLWKVDVESADSANWASALQVAGVPQPLFTAKDADDAVQPITSKPEVGRNSDGTLMVFFGTGRYLSPGDNIVDADTQTQTFYGLLDTNAQITGRGELQVQTITSQGLVGTHNVRTVSRNALDASDRGWYIDLIYGGTVTGERVVADPILRNNRIIFPTMIPSLDPCSFGGSGWLMQLDAFTGGQLTTPAFDLDGDGTYDDYAGLESEEGMINTPAYLSAGGTAYLITSGTSGELDTTKISGNTSASGRQSWRQIR